MRKVISVLAILCVAAPSVRAASDMPPMPERKPVAAHVPIPLAKPSAPAEIPAVQATHPVPMSPTTSASPGFQRAPRWVINQDQSHIRFSGIEAGAPFSVEFTAWSSEIYFDPKNLGGSNVTLTVDTRSSTGGKKTFTEYLAAPPWFNPGQTPLATFQSTAMRQIGQDTFEIKGRLILQDAGRKMRLPFPGIELPVVALLKNETGSFTSRFTFAVPDFSINAKPKATGRLASKNIKYDMLLTGRKAGN